MEKHNNAVRDLFYTIKIQDEYNYSSKWRSIKINPITAIKNFVHLNNIKSEELIDVVLELITCKNIFDFTKKSELPYFIKNYEVNEKQLLKIEDILKKTERYLCTTYNLIYSIDSIVKQNIPFAKKLLKIFKDDSINISMKKDLGSILMDVEDIKFEVENELYKFAKMKQDKLILNIEFAEVLMKSIRLYPDMIVFLFDIVWDISTGLKIDEYSIIDDKLTALRILEKYTENKDKILNALVYIFKNDDLYITWNEYQYNDLEDFFVEMKPKEEHIYQLIDFIQNPNRASLLDKEDDSHARESILWTLLYSIENPIDKTALLVETLLMQNNDKGFMFYIIRELRGRELNDMNREKLHTFSRKSNISKLFRDKVITLIE